MSYCSMLYKYNWQNPIQHITVQPYYVLLYFYSGKQSVLTYGTLYGIG